MLIKFFVGRIDMPLMRASVPSVAHVPPQAAREALMASLTAPDAATRRGAARALSGDAEAAAALALCLETETEAQVRDALFAAIVAVGSADAADLMLPLLRLDDAALRGGAVEALKLFKAAAIPALDRALGDPDPDVRILAVEVTRAWSSDMAGPRLRRIIESDPHVNVCGAAVDVATEVGTYDLVTPLAELRIRFADDPFLVFAVDVASARINEAGKRGT